MRVLGIDPGTVTVGWGVVEDGRAIDYGAIRINSKWPIQCRLKKIFDQVRRLVKKYHPGRFAIEGVFAGTNKRTSIQLGRGSGVAILAAHMEDLDIMEIAPCEIKKCVCGSGGASKLKVANAMTGILGLPRPPDTYDEGDALAVAWVCGEKLKWQMN